MFQLLSAYWPHIFFVLSIVMGATAAIHVAMTKEEVRSAVGWVGIIILSPVIGTVLYLFAVSIAFAARPLERNVRACAAPCWSI